MRLSALGVALLAVGVCAACSSATPVTSTTRRAVIIDQLSLTNPNPDFAAQARGLLESAGYVVEYIPGEQVSVDLFRTLPQRGDDLVILRVHSARQEEGGRKTDSVSIFTGETMDLRKININPADPAVATAMTEARREGLPTSGMGLSTLTNEELQHVDAMFYTPGMRELPKFGIMPSFMEQVAQGQFDNTMVVMMGCDGLRSNEMANAFIGKGASSFISWDEPVTAEHTDAATLELLELIAAEGMTVAEAIEGTMAEHGPDPYYGARLVEVSR